MLAMPVRSTEFRIMRSGILKIEGIEQRNENKQLHYRNHYCMSIEAQVDT
jgi:hypothetical protein